MAETDELDAEKAVALDSVIATGTPQPVGGISFWFADERWEWSDEVAAMHGYRPGEIQPTTKLLLSHKHPDDRDQVAAVITKMIEHREPFSSRHRIIDTSGEVHHVIVVADLMLDDADNVVGTAGYYVDLTDHDVIDEALDDVLPDLLAARAAIEQVKGALMLIYGITDEQAFRVLRWRSQETNTKLRALAEQLASEIGLLSGDPATLRTRFDHLLLTVHQRMAPEHAVIADRPDCDAGDTMRE